MTITIKRGTDKKTLEALWAKLRELTFASKGFDSSKFCGLIQLDKDALAIQKEMRNEW